MPVVVKERKQSSSSSCPLLLEHWSRVNFIIILQFMCISFSSFCYSAGKPDSQFHFYMFFFNFFLCVATTSDTRSWFPVLLFSLTIKWAFTFAFTFRTLMSPVQKVPSLDNMRQSRLPFFCTILSAIMRHRYNMELLVLTRLVVVFLSLSLSIEQNKASFELWPALTEWM